MSKTKSGRKKLLVKGPWDSKANLEDFTGWVPPQTDGQGWTYYREGVPQSWDTLSEGVKNIAKLTINHLKKSDAINKGKKAALHAQGNEAIRTVISKIGEVTTDHLINQPGTFGTSKAKYKQKVKELDKNLENEYGW